MKFSVIGTSPKRLDGPAKVSGRARYTDDMTMPGMRHAAFVRATIAHGHVKRMDTTAALALPGVEAVFTRKDVPDFLYPTAGHPYSIYADHGDVADRTIVTDYVRFYGDEIGLVVARDQMTARKAAHLIKVEYEELPVMTDPEQAMAPGAAVLHPEICKDNIVGQHTLAVNGDLETGLALADLVLDGGTYKTPTVQHCHLENHTAFAYMDDMKRLTVVSSTQIPHICRRIVGQALDIPWGDVRVIKPYIGGGFGNKQDVCLEPVVAFLTSKLNGVPVSLEMSREECMLATRVRHAFAMKTRIGLTKSGQITGFSLDVVSNTGAYASHGHSIVAAGGSKVCYVYPRAPYVFSARTVYTNIPVGGAFRGYGSPQTVFGIECAIEEAARALGMDPLEFRLLNSGRPGDLSPLNGKPLHSLGVSQCLEKGRDAFEWARRRAACEAFNAESIKNGSPLRRGVGVAAFSYGTGTYPINVEPGSARLILNQDGTVNLAVGATEIGQGSDTAFAQMVAEVTGLPLDHVRVISTQDTDVTPFDTGSYASRQTYTCAPAIYEAASTLRQRILEHAGLMTGHVPAAMAIEGPNVVFARKPDTVILSLNELALDSYYNKDRGGQITAEASVVARQNPPAFGCSYTEIEVDIQLCKIHVRQIMNVHDAGRLINPDLATAQVQGGMGMGIGWALYEELIIDPKSGKVYNNNLLDYKFPTACDMPDLQALFVETNEPSGPFGTKALGEPPLLPPAPALRNALLHATGVAVNSIPLTPKVLFESFQREGLV